MARESEHLTIVSVVEGQRLPNEAYLPLDGPDAAIWYGEGPYGGDYESIAGAPRIVCVACFPQNVGLKNRHRGPKPTSETPKPKL